MQNLLQDFTIVTWKAVEYASHYMTAVWSEMLKEKIWATEELHFKMVKTNKQEGTSGTEYKTDRIKRFEGLIRMFPHLATPQAFYDLHKDRKTRGRIKK